MSTHTVAPRMQTPSPGAVCPAMVMYGARMRTRFFRWMVPATLNTTMRGPTALHASRNVPGPASSRLVTTYTLPPRPPKLYMPPPHAPGNAGMSACGRSDGFAAPGMYGLPFFAHSASSGCAFAHTSSSGFS